VDSPKDPGSLIQEEGSVKDGKKEFVKKSDFISKFSIFYRYGWTTSLVKLLRALGFNAVIDIWMMRSFLTYFFKSP